MAADVAQTSPESGPLAAVCAARVPPALVAGGVIGNDNVAGASAADVGKGRLGADLGAGDFLAEGEDAALGGGVSVTGTAAARVESGVADGGGRGLGGNAGGGGCGRGAEEVACAAAAGVGVAVLSYGWVRLGDEVRGGRHFGCVSLFVWSVLERFVGRSGSENGWYV